MTLIEQRCYESQSRYAHNKNDVIQHGRDFPDLKPNGHQQCEVDRTGETSHQERVRNLTYFPFRLHSIAFLLEQKSSLTYEEVRGNDVGTSLSKQDPVFVTGWKKLQKTIEITWTWTLVRSHLEPGLRGPREPCVL